jgi:acetate kinase
MLILVINCGSSSLKYQLLNMENESVLAEGNCEKIGLSDSFLKHKPTGKESVVVIESIPNHLAAVRLVLKSLTDAEVGVVKSMDEISAVGHRIVHGGEFFSNSVLIDEKVIEAVKACAKIAPLHNPPNITGIEACQTLLPNIPMVGVFDTAFHQTMPAYAYMYGLPYEIYEKYKIRRYGFHGTSHRYISIKTAEILGKPIEELKIISCHLGNGASVCAINGGKSVDSSMGYTPLDGLIMGTRCGSIDASIVFELIENEGMSIPEVKNLLNKKSGMLGLSGISSDFRDIEEKLDNPRVKIAIDSFCYRVKKYVGEYMAVLNGVDAIVFTAGVGENDPLVREKSVEGLKSIGIRIDVKKNQEAGRGFDFVDLTGADSKVKILAIHTNEELMIARDTYKIVNG